MKRAVSYSPQMRAALFYARKRRLARIAAGNETPPFEGWRSFDITAADYQGAVSGYSAGAVISPAFGSISREPNAEHSIEVFAIQGTTLVMYITGDCRDYLAENTIRIDGTPLVRHAGDLFFDGTYTQDMYEVDPALMPVGSTVTALYDELYVPAPKEFRYARVRSTSLNSNSVFVANLEFRDVIGGPDLTLFNGDESKAFASSIAAGSAPILAFDNFASSAQSPDGITEFSIGWDFGAASKKKIVEISIQHSPAYPNRTMKTFVVEGSDDMVNWTAFFEQSTPVVYDGNYTAVSSGG